MARTELSTEASWYKDAIIYQLHVKSFFDSDADGVGDFRGLAQKMDYLQDLGVTAVWLLPFYPSPLRDDGYDIADYTRIHPSYGTMRDFRSFLREAHKRDLKVITELVINHTSDQHPWFQRARHSPKGSAARDFYVWSDTPEPYSQARIIFQDFEPSNWTWDPVAGQYFWHRFYSHQPDLNFENPRVRKAVKDAMDFWMKMGVDGMRLDAIPYLFEREGTNCENLPETHEFLKELRGHLDERYEDRMLLAEANQWPEDAVTYFGDGDECHMSFHFPLMPRLFMALRSEDRFPILDILQQTPAIPESSQWAIFLRNHDELTLEMVTDEERDYMYRSYATDPQMRINLGIRRRLAPLLGSNRRQIELMNGLLFSMPGTPIVYYGDELGMGDNVYLGDRNGVRTPMQWSADRNAGFSAANPHMLFLPAIIDPEHHYEYVNVESQQNNPRGLHGWTKRLIALRKQHPAFGRGTLDMLHPDNHRVIAFLRRYEDEQILVVANLSRFTQAVELDLADYRGRVPLEMFGRSEFPPIEEGPYFLSLAPHAFNWFLLTPQRDRIELGGALDIAPHVTVRGPWTRIFSGRGTTPFERELPGVLRRQHWFAAKARRLRSTFVEDIVPLETEGRRTASSIVLVRTEYFEGEPEIYSLPLTYMDEGDASEVDAAQVMMHVHSSDGDGLLLDGPASTEFQEQLLGLVSRRRSTKGHLGSVTGVQTGLFRRLRGPAQEHLDPRMLRTEQSNSSVVYGDRLILKLYRRLHGGVIPDLEIGQFLSEKRNFRGTPRTAGYFEYRRGHADPVTVGILQELVENSGDGWEYALAELDRFYERALARTREDKPPVYAPDGLDLLEGEIPEEAWELLGDYLDAARMIGERTGDMHMALASPDHEAFAPEPFGQLYRRSLYQSMRGDARRTMQALRRAQRSAESPFKEEIAELAEGESTLLEFMRQVTTMPIKGKRIRIHGDYHLGQLLYTGRDFVIIDFEGEPVRPMGERRIKRSPLRDVAGMLRSFHYAANAPLVDRSTSVVRPDEELEAMAGWASYWYGWARYTFLRGYLETVEGSDLLPADPQHLSLLLDSYLMQQAMYEITYEMNNRPDWLAIPVAGALELLRGMGDDS